MTENVSIEVILHWKGVKDQVSTQRRKVLCAASWGSFQIFCTSPREEGSGSSVCRGVCVTPVIIWGYASHSLPFSPNILLLLAIVSVTTSLFSPRPILPRLISTCLTFPRSSRSKYRHSLSRGLFLAARLSAICLRIHVPGTLSHHTLASHAHVCMSCLGLLPRHYKYIS